MDLTPVTPSRSRSRGALPIAAPLAALVYPGILWCGVRASPVFVAASLAVPLLGLVAAARLDGTRMPRARAVAHFVVAAPPLFSLLGGWLDFQHAVPLTSLRVWIPLWIALVVVAGIERPGEGEGEGALATAPIARRRLAVAHGVSAAVIVLFALPHLVNHLAGLFGGDAHIAVMTALRGIYRHRLVEPVLLAAVVFQIASGAWLVRRKLARPAGWLDTLQTASGVYLLVFFLSHVSAALRTRLRGGDPDWRWLAGGELLSDPWSVRLVPYYFLAVIALGVHAGCGLHTVLRGHRVGVRGDALLAIVAGLATVVSALILIGLFRA
jgi:succinate dehydrogenase/fumarate reductase cytochrome b subunit